MESINGTARMNSIIVLDFGDCQLPQSKGYWRKTVNKRERRGRGKR